MMHTLVCELEIIVAGLIMIMRSPPHSHYNYNYMHMHMYNMHASHMLTLRNT